MVDVGPPVVRATILVLVACIAVWLGRRPLGFNSLAAAALVVLALNPAHLFHVGAQLSFLCVAGLIWFATRRPHRTMTKKDTRARTLERLIMAEPELAGMDEAKAEPQRDRHRAGRLVLWLLTLPLVMARFHVFRWWRWC